MFRQPRIFINTCVFQTPQTALSLTPMFLVSIYTYPFQILFLILGPNGPNTIHQPSRHQSTSLALSALKPRGQPQATSPFLPQAPRACLKPGQCHTLSHQKSAADTRRIVSCSHKGVRRALAEGVCPPKRVTQPKAEVAMIPARSQQKMPQGASTLKALNSLGGGLSTRLLDSPSTSCSEP